MWFKLNLLPVSMVMLFAMSVLQIHALPADFFTEKSKLAEGNWIKISVSENGVYEITYDELREMGFDNPENPTIIEDFIRAIGAEPVIYARRNECCGGYCTIENKNYAKKQVDAIMDNAKAMGAQILVTACPLCMYNLKHNSADGLDVKYFTELLAEALGVKEEA